MTINLADKLRLQIGVPTGGLPNLLANPDGRALTAGWSSVSSAMQIDRFDLGDGPFIQLRQLSGVDPYAYTDPALCPAGRYVAASFQTRTATGSPTVAYFTILVQCLDADGAVLATSSTSGFLQHSSGTTRSYSNPVLAPAGTVAARMQVRLFGNTSGGAPVSGSYIWLSDAMLTHAATSAALTAGYGYEPPHDWLDVLGPTHEISTDTSALNLGTLTAEILDADLDPALVDTVRPGKPVRLQALVDGVWEDVFTGTTSNGTTAYDKRKGGDLSEKGAVRVTLSATNAIAPLSNLGESRGVETIADLRQLVRGRGVGWRINGSTSAYFAPLSVISRNDSASILDQIAITRDSNLGYAWVDRHNWLNVTATSSSTAQLALTDDVAGATEDLVYSYVDADVAYSTGSCINEVTIKFLRYNAEEQSTEEIAYGPYRDEASIATYGAYTAEFTIQAPAEDEFAIQLYAASILTANAVPQITARTVVINARDDLGVQVAATADLYAPVRVVYADRVDSVVRISSIKHTISATNDGGKWLTTYGFEPASGVAAPTVTPSPPAVVNAVGLLSSRYRTTTQALSNNVETTVNFDAAVDADGIPYASGVWTVPKKGRYLVSATVTFAVNGTGTRQARLQKNGSGYVKIGSAGGTTQSHISAEVSDTVKCNAGDTLRILALQSSGGNLDVAGGTSKWTTASITYLGI